jgi:hypothetical protein
VDCTQWRQVPALAAEYNSPAEVKLAKPTLDTNRVPNRWRRGHPRQRQQHLIFDKAYDSNPLREQLRKCGTELVVPRKAGRMRPATQG